MSIFNFFTKKSKVKVLDLQPVPKAQEQEQAQINKEQVPLEIDKEIEMAAKQPQAKIVSSRGEESFPDVKQLLTKLVVPYRQAETIKLAKDPVKQQEIDNEKRLEMRTKQSPLDQDLYRYIFRTQVAEPQNES